MNDTDHSGMWFSPPAERRKGEVFLRRLGWGTIRVSADSQGNRVDITGRVPTVVVKAAILRWEVENGDPDAR